MASANVKEAADPQEARDAYDLLTNKLGQLDAMLVMIGGEGVAAFNLMNEVMQSNYLWACQNMVEECQGLAQSLSPAIFGGAHA